MSDGGRGISLRKKKASNRPQISAPRPVPEDEPPSETPAVDNGAFDGPTLMRTETSMSSLRARPGAQGADRTADLVKRRYSTRFVGYPVDAGMPPPMPSMPSLPPQFQRQASQSPTREERVQNIGSRNLKLDVRALRDPSLIPEQYIAHILGDADESDVLAYQTELRKLKNRTSTDLQHNVYKNRTQFIKISKEAEKLKTEMRTLRGLMSELTSALHQAAQAAGAEVSAMSVADRKRANRSSVANLEALWSTHLQALWQRVEGSQKYLPAAPGRHILYESSRWVELNAATWKPRRRVHVILLNDHLLIATEKKRSDIPGSSPQMSNGRRPSVAVPVAPQNTLVADRCFPLQDVQMTDISRKQSSKSSDDRSPVSNAVSVRVGNESFTFATGSSSDSAAEKNSLLVSYRKAHEELRKQLAAQHGERERALDEMAYLAASSDRRGSSKSSSPLVGFSNSRPGSSGQGMIDVDGRPQPLRWVETQLDGLDIDVALQRFEEAVARTEKLRRTARAIRGNPAAQEIFLAKIDERATKLANVLARRLRQNSGGLDKTRENVAWLVRLGQDDRAVSEYLDSRTETVKQRTRQLPFTGSLPPHISALSYVTFHLILHTLQIFTASFPGSNYTSAAVRWAKLRLDDFNAALSRRLSGLPEDSELRQQCLADAKEQCSVLRKVGVDFEDLVGVGTGD
ncbi:hypothetical protein K461DRAFT_288334 [Myriangium duriaei CBS 260.36]|uniref:Exocyst complex component EXO84 n=1 Tax=Myriangium duriaei CBS 260.36 TaxID=1168546 RepID=A0A9P4MD86_9PEZI|nr:hypothetical protein K461DRAFT_288334 [Myriangium duriaei CBS 260.36]